MGVVQQGMYKQIAVFLLLFVFLLASGYPITPSWLWLIPIILVQYLMVATCAMIGAVLVCYIRDFSMLISLGTLFLLFMSGIFWDVRELQDPQMRDTILAVNPIAFLIDAYRGALMYERAPSMIHLAMITLVFSGFLIAVVTFMRRANQQLALKALTA